MPGGYASCGGVDPIFCRHMRPSRSTSSESDFARQPRTGGNTCGHWWRSIRTRLLDYARQDQGTVDKIFKDHFKFGIGIENRP